MAQKSSKQRRLQEKRAQIKELRGLLKSAQNQLTLWRKRERDLITALGRLHKMRQGGGRAKGNSYENEIAKALVRALGLSVTDCYRTPGSGGHRYAKKKDPGDLVLSPRARKRFPFSVECKHYREVDLYPFWLPQKLWPKSWNVKAWLKQTCDAAQWFSKSGVYPLLVFRQNNKADMVAFPDCVRVGNVPFAMGLNRGLRFRYNQQLWVLVRFRDLLKQLRRKHEG